MGKQRERFESLVWRLNDIERRLAALEPPSVTGWDESSIERLNLRTPSSTATAPADPLGSRFEEQMGTAAREWVNAQPGKPTPSSSTPFWECQTCEADHQDSPVFRVWWEQMTEQARNYQERHAKSHQSPQPAQD